MPAYKAGGPIQSINNLVNNFTEDISYKIFCSNADVDGTLLNVPCDQWVKYNEHTMVWYASKENYTINLLKNVINSCRPHVLYINGIYSWYFNLAPLLFCHAPQKIVSVRGMLHPGALTQKAFKKKWYLLFLKIIGLPHKCTFHASDENEKKYIQDTFGNKVSIQIAKNFPKVLYPKEPPKKSSGSLHLISIALISPMKNILLVLQALKKIPQKIIYTIYGAVKDELYWKTCLQEINGMPVNITVRFEVDLEPANVEKALLPAHVFILPSKSENFGHAIFESLSAGKPVITTNNTPWKLLQNSKAGINVSAESMSSLTDAIILFTGMGQHEYNLWSANAAAYAAKAINTGDIKKQYRMMFHT